MSRGAPTTFDDAWVIASSLPGWLTEAQARLLWDCAREVRPGAVLVEIGSHQGRSTVILGSAMAATGGRVIAVDPFVDGKLFGGTSTRDKFRSNISAAGLDDVVELVSDYSTHARKTWSQRFDYLYIDGKHDYWTFSDDLRWAAHLPSGAPILVHDCFSSIGVTLGVLRHVLPSRALTYEHRAGSMALFRKRRPATRDRARILREMPWWLRNVVVKILLRLRLRGVARILGHSGRYDPY